MIYGYALRGPQAASGPRFVEAHARAAEFVLPPGEYILGSPHNPKFLWVDDVEIVGDRITEARPVLGNFFAQKTERRISELGACCVAFVVRDVSVHEAPQTLDRIQMRAIGRNEM
jgi:hypothetical protein